MKSPSQPLSQPSLCPTLHDVPFLADMTLLRGEQDIDAFLRGASPMSPSLQPTLHQLRESHQRLCVWGCIWHEKGLHKTASEESIGVMILTTDYCVGPHVPCVSPHNSLLMRITRFVLSWEAPLQVIIPANFEWCPLIDSTHTIRLSNSIPTHYP